MKKIYFEKDIKVSLRAQCGNLTMFLIKILGIGPLLSETGFEKKSVILYSNDFRRLRVFKEKTT